MKYYILPFGCQMNRSDVERIKTVIEAMGYQESDLEDDAQLIGIVACSVRQKAIDKVYAKIRSWNQRKDRQNLITFVTGCILDADKEKFLKQFDILFTPAELDEFPTMLKQYGVVTGQSAGLVDPRRIDSFWQVNPTYTSKFEAFVPIQNGCDKFCTFCAVPYTRGREVSRSSTEILAEVEDLIHRDYKSITLLGQNVNSYGHDKRSEGEISFGELLRRIGEMGLRMFEKGKRCWVYFTSPHPRDMTDDVLEIVAQYPVLAKQIHLPLQSGDDKLLMRMNRNHTLDAYRQIVRSIRSKMPTATLFTDIIVGFTGETDTQFKATEEAMREFQFDMAYIAMYSPRPGAASFRWEDNVAHDDKRKRYHGLSEILKETGLKANEKRLGKRCTVLVDGVSRKTGILFGKTEGKIPIQFESGNTDLVGQFVEVEVISVTPLSIAGRLIETSVSVEACSEKASGPSPL